MSKCERGLTSRECFVCASPKYGAVASGAGEGIPPRIFVVIDEAGEPEFSATWPEACHEHINDAIMDGIVAAGNWKVREYAAIGAAQQESPPLAAEKEKQG